MNTPIPEPKPQLDNLETRPHLPTPPHPLTITSLDELQGLVDAPVYCQFAIDDQIVRIPCRRASQSLDEQVRAIRREAQPKRIPNADPAKEYYDYGDKDYMAKRDTNEKIARALLVYCGCPAVAEKKPGLTIPKDIYEFVRTILSENILELIAGTVAVGGIGIVSQVGFTATAGSEN